MFESLWKKISFNGFYEFVKQTDFPFAENKIKLKPFVNEERKMMKDIANAVSIGDHLRGNLNLNISLSGDIDFLKKFEWGSNNPFTKSI